MGLARLARWEEISGAELTEDWKKVLFNQFHDLAAGSGIGIIYKEAQKDYDVVRYSTNEISSHSLETVDERVNTAGNGIAGRGLQPAGWERSGEVEVHVQGGKTAAERVGSAGCRTRNQTRRRTFRCDAARAASAGAGLQGGVGRRRKARSEQEEKRREREGNRAARSRWKTRFSAWRSTSRSGCITSLFDKKSNFETLASGACGNQLQFFKDTPKDYDAWNIDPGTLDVAPTTIEHADSVELVKTAEPTHPRHEPLGRIQNSCRRSA